MLPVCTAAIQGQASARRLASPFPRSPALEAEEAEEAAAAAAIAAPAPPQPPQPQEQLDTAELLRSFAATLSRYLAAECGVPYSSAEHRRLLSQLVLPVLAPAGRPLDCTPEELDDLVLHELLSLAAEAADAELAATAAAKQQAAHATGEGRKKKGGKREEGKKGMEGLNANHYITVPSNDTAEDRTRAATCLRAAQYLNKVGFTRLKCLSVSRLKKAFRRPSGPTSAERCAGAGA